MCVRVCACVFIHVCVCFTCVFHMCVSHVCVHVCVSHVCDICTFLCGKCTYLYMGIYQRKTSGILLYYFLPYSLEIVCPVDPETSLASSQALALLLSLSLNALGSQVGIQPVY